MNYTTYEVARKLGLCHQRVRQLAVAYGVAKLGQAWAWTDADIARMQARPSLIRRRKEK